MNSKQAIALTGLVAATAGVSPLAFAQDSGWYLAVNLGQSNAKNGCPNLVAAGQSCDDISSAYGVFGGYQFNKYLGAEAGYTYLGEFTASQSAMDLTNKVKGYELLGVGTFPINPQFEVYGKVGAFFWNVKESCTGTCTFNSQTETGNKLTYALGAQYNFTKNVGGRVQYQRYQDVGNASTTGQSDYDVLSVGVVFKF